MHGRDNRKQRCAGVGPMTIDQLHDLGKALGAITAVVTTMWGAWRYVKPSVVPYLHALAQLHKMPAMLHDIRKEVRPNGGSSMRDELRNTSNDLRRIGATMRAHFDTNDDGHFEADAQGRFSHINETLRRWCDRSRSDLFGLGWFSCVAEHDRDKVRDEWLEAVAEGREFRKYFAMVAANGNEFTVNAQAGPVRDTVTGEVMLYVGHIRRRHHSGVRRAVSLDDGS